MAELIRREQFFRGKNPDDMCSWISRYVGIPPADNAFYQRFAFEFGILQILRGGMQGNGEEDGSPADENLRRTLP